MSGSSMLKVRAWPIWAATLLLAVAGHVVGPRDGAANVQGGLAPGTPALMRRAQPAVAPAAGSTAAASVPAAAVPPLQGTAPAAPPAAASSALTQHDAAAAAASAAVAPKEAPPLEEDEDEEEDDDSEPMELQPGGGRGLGTTKKPGLMSRLKSKIPGFKKSKKKKQPQRRPQKKRRPVKTGMRTWTPKKLEPVSNGRGLEVIGKANISVAPTAPTDAPALGVACQDNTVTGISFHSGQQATCRELHSYCRHPVFGQRVRDRCSRTCGLCELETVGTDGKDGGAYCMDGAAGDPPIFTLEDKVTDCRDLRLFCRTDTDVRWKCRATCGVCLGETTSTTTSNVTTIIPTEFPPTTTSTTPDISRLEREGMGCSRRRTMGFCASRRRGP